MLTSLTNLQRALALGELSCVEAARAYLERIQAVDRSGPCLNAVIETNPDALEIAAELDAERARGATRGPLHGIPVLIKDNIDTADRMSTTAGSLALAGAPAARDAGVVARLRRAGCVILGKTNLSEWANFRGFRSTSGWSGRGGLTRNPHALDRNCSGSSSGSAAAAAAFLCAAALGTETDGSIVSPSNACGVVGIKPTVGLTSRAGVVPISSSQDTVGIHSRSVADGAALLGALAARDPRDPATLAAPARRRFADYTRFLRRDGLRGTRVGVVRNAGMTGYSHAADTVLEEAIRALRAAGATVVDPVAFPDPLAGNYATDLNEIIVLVYEFKRSLDAYLQERPGVAARSLDEVITFNRREAAREMPWFGQEWMELAASEVIPHALYKRALAQSREQAGPLGIDAALSEHRLDALVAPTGGPAWLTDLAGGDTHSGGVSSPAARCGYPLVTVPAGTWCGLPVGVTFMAGAWSEPLLLRIAYAFEQETQARVDPAFAPTLPAAADPTLRAPAPSIADYLADLRARRASRAPSDLLASLAKLLAA